MKICNDKQEKLCSNVVCLICFNRSFALNPKSQFWSNKNILKSHQVFKCSGKKFIFDCNKCNHEFEILLSNLNAGHWCPYCTNKKLCGNEKCLSCFEKSFASHPKRIYWSSKNNLAPIQVSKCSAKKIIFNCCHEFEISLANVYNGSWCPYCANRKLCENEECLSCFEKSFASHPKSIYWSDKNNLIPIQVFKNNHQKYIFNCCHEFESSLTNINNGSWCPYCANPSRKLCENKECIICFEKSFASHQKSIYWSHKNIFTPRQVFKNSDKKIIFNCYECLHIFEVSLSNLNNDNWCPFCVNKQLCENKNCIICFEKSFTSHPKAIYWSDKNTILPRQIFKCSSKKIIFKCENNHNFEISLSSIYYGQWCPFCINKTEGKLLEYLKTNYNDIVQYQIKFDWSKTEKSYRFYDFQIDNILIELDGRQHFEQVSNWISPKENQKIDLEKNNLALNNGYSIIRICQKSVWNDKENWEEKLNYYINKLKELKQPEIIFIGSIYKKFLFV